jgi:glyoxylase I family protein
MAEASPTFEEAPARLINDVGPVPIVQPPRRVREVPNMSNGFVPDVNAAIVRYQVADPERSLTFYTELLGFRLVQRGGPVIIVARGDLHLLLSGPGASGGRPMPDGTQQGPGGWNRIVLYVDDFDAWMAAIEKAETHLRNAIESGPTGRQILLDDPDGNPIELHEVTKG